MQMEHSAVHRFLAVGLLLAAPVSATAAAVITCAHYSITGDNLATSSSISKSCVASVCAGQTLTYGTTATVGGVPSVSGASALTGATCTAGDTYIKLVDATGFVSGGVAAVSLVSSTPLQTADNDALKTTTGGGGGCDNGAYTVDAGVSQVLIAAGCHNAALCSATPAFIVTGACSSGAPAPAPSAQCDASPATGSIQVCQPPPLCPLPPSLPHARTSLCPQVRMALAPKARVSPLLSVFHLEVFHR